MLMLIFMLKIYTVSEKKHAITKTCGMMILIIKLYFVSLVSSFVSRVIIYISRIFKASFYIYF